MEDRLRDKKMLFFAKVSLAVPYILRTANVILPPGEFGKKRERVPPPEGGGWSGRSDSLIGVFPI